MTKPKVISYIRDDLGHAWYFKRGKIRCVLADLELGKENGYFCDSFEDGVAMLNEMGYISGIEYDEFGDYEEEYFHLKAHAEGW
jgi:hypothetical protein